MEVTLPSKLHLASVLVLVLSCNGQSQSLGRGCTGEGSHETIAAKPISDDDDHREYNERQRGKEACYHAPVEDVQNQGYGKNEEHVHGYKYNYVCSVL